MRKILSIIGFLGIFMNLANASATASHTAFYAEPKVVYTFGETVRHEHANLKGDHGYGIGFDIGYLFTKHFGLEIDGTYSRSKVKERNLHGVLQEEDTASFYSYGINSVFTYPMSKHFILLGKLGYMAEHEDLGSLNIEGTEHGAAWAFGLEYEVNEHIEISCEYEDANIDSVRGASLQLGLIYKFF